MNVKAKSLVDSKVNPKIKARRIYLLIKYHDRLCLMLNGFNHFWKYLLIPILLFYVLLIWFSVYVPIIYLNLDLLPKLFMHFLLVEVIGIVACIVIIIFNVSIEVTVIKIELN